MKFYIFKSETQRNLRAFAGDIEGASLPATVGPWSATGIVPADKNPPHGLSRGTIEQAITRSGYQLWRMKTPNRVAASAPV